MLREWHSPSAASFLAEEVIDEATDDADDVVLWDGTEDDKEQPLISARLETPQRTELDELLREFGDVLSNRLGKTQIAECRINAVQPLQSDSHRIVSHTPIVT